MLNNSVHVSSLEKMVDKCTISIILFSLNGILAFDFPVDTKKSTHLENRIWGGKEVDLKEFPW